MKRKDDHPKTVCEASDELIRKAAADGVSTVFERAEAMKPCSIGAEGSCCKNCSMGPCRLPSSGKLKENGEKRRVGICGATIETVAARNFVRMIAGGASAHSDHGRGIAEVFLAAAKGEIPGYEIKDTQKLFELAMDFGIDIDEFDTREIGIKVGELSLSEWGRQEGELVMARRAPLRRQEVWRKQNVFPRGIDREIVETMHRTHMGVDQDYKNLITQGTRTAIADGWGGSMLATELQDILFGTPVPVRGSFNLGVLKEEEVNIIIHGHEPLLSEMVVVAAQDPELVALASSYGAKGITIAGICCTANEVLMRHGIPIAGNFLQQELAIATGVVDAMIVDVQCIMQSIFDVAQCYHTNIITTSPKGKIAGAKSMRFDEHNALESAKGIVRAAVDNYPNRLGGAKIPNKRCEGIAGFSHETIDYMLGGMFRASYRPLNDNIINGRIRGIAGVVGCNNVRTSHDWGHITLIKELIKNDVLVLTTGCAAIACGKEGLLLPETAASHAGSGLAEVCEAVGIPPVLHMGSCVDNSRILMAASAVVKEGGLGDDICDVPLAGAAPEWMSEKAVSIGHYFVASGIYTIFGRSFPTAGSDVVTAHLFRELEEELGGMWDVARDPGEMAEKMIAHIDRKRKALGIDRARERVLYDMSMRRELEAG
ncbi:MAG: anaerobic carbon-monoxide dehydrogenase catalytic subunit [Deltaproteobacteria bacterium]|nr:anaerobic carbon-monoxide dehydrogenase catalytic subunit [Deltaproteobacteria bacterium]